MIGTCLDKQPHGEIVPANIRRASQIAAEIRSSPLLLKAAEALCIERHTGQDVWMDRVTTSYVRRHLCDEGVEDYTKRCVDGNLLAEIQKLSPFEFLRISPLCCALTLGAESGVPFKPARHLRMISDMVCDAWSGLGKRFCAINCPPRHGKSWLVSRFGNDWALANRPDRFTCALGYSDEFSRIFGRMTRDDVTENSSLFGFAVSEDSRSQSDWLTSLGVNAGGFWSAGPGGSVIGRRLDHGCLDDVTKSLQEALSAAVQQEIFAWWQSSVRTRVQRGGVVIAISSRWATNDLCGRILASPDADEWATLNFPAIADEKSCALHYPGCPNDKRDAIGRAPGDALAPELGFDIDELTRTKNALDYTTWQAMYAGVPIDEQARGRCYDSYKYSEHVRDVGFDPRFPVCLAADFNVGHCVWELFQHVKTTSSLYQVLRCEELHDVTVFDEIAMADTNSYAMVSELIARLHVLSRQCPGGHLYLKLYGDYTARRRQTSSDSDDWSIIGSALNQQNSWLAFEKCLAPNPPVIDRVNCANRFLRGANGEVRMQISPRCTELIQDFLKVRWARSISGQVLSTEDQKTDPSRSHASSALGYGLFRLQGDSHEILLCAVR
jgi:hypothetical protein